MFKGIHDEEPLTNGIDGDVPFGKDETNPSDIIIISGRADQCEDAKKALQVGFLYTSFFHSLNYVHCLSDFLSYDTSSLLCWDKTGLITPDQQLAMLGIRQTVSLQTSSLLCWG